MNNKWWATLITQTKNFNLKLTTIKIISLRKISYHQWMKAEKTWTKFWLSKINKLMSVPDIIKIKATNNQIIWWFTTWKYLKSLMSLYLISNSKWIVLNTWQRGKNQVNCFLIKRKGCLVATHVRWGAILVASVMFRVEFPVRKIGVKKVLDQIQEKSNTQMYVSFWETKSCNSELIS